MLNLCLFAFSENRQFLLKQLDKLTKNEISREQLLDQVDVDSTTPYVTPIQSPVKTKKSTGKKTSAKKSGGKEKKVKESTSAKKAGLASAHERAKSMLSHPQYASSDDSLVLQLQKELAELKKKVSSQPSLEDGECNLLRLSRLLLNVSENCKSLFD